MSENLVLIQTAPSKIKKLSQIHIIKKIVEQQIQNSVSFKLPPWIKDLKEADVDDIQNHIYPKYCVHKYI